MSGRERILQRVAPVYGPVLGHGFKWLSSPAYRHKHAELERLRRLPRAQKGISNLLDPEVEFVDAPSFLWMWREIFERELYRFSSALPSPRILDGGANIGLASLYWKRLFPLARITAFEPDPQVAAVLRSNLARAQVQDVEVVECALWDTETTIFFAGDGADGGRIGTQNDATIPVQTARLSSWLQEDVDLLKLDIEGAETRVLRDCDSHLSRVRRLFVEYHGFSNAEQMLPELLVQLRDAGFRLHLESEFHAARPFVERPLNANMDNRINIFAWRPD